MWIVATAAVWLSGIKITCVQSNVRSNDCSVLKHRTDKDENKVSWTDWSFYLQLRRIQSDNRLFARCLLNHLLSSSPVITLILKAQLSTVEQQNMDRTAHRSVSIGLYSNPSCAIILHTSLSRISKGSVNAINAHLNSIPPDAHYIVNMRLEETYIHMHSLHKHYSIQWMYVIAPTMTSVDWKLFMQASDDLVF